MTEFTVAIQQFAYPPPYQSATDIINEIDVDTADEDYIGEEINKMMDDMIPPMVDKRKEVIADPCQCPFKSVEIFISSLSKPHYQRGRICDNRTIEAKSSNSKCVYGGTCKQFFFKLRFNENPSDPNQFSIINVPIDCRCLS